MKAKEEANVIIALQNLLQIESEMTQYVQVMARIHKAYYTTLIKEGFTKSQAIELVKAMGFNLAK